MKCIEVTTARTSAGYGTTAINIGGREYHVLAHRMAYELAHGPLPKGALVCHTCDNRACVNVDHLFMGSHRDNLLDSYNKGRDGWNLGHRKTHCVNGHEYTPANTYLDPQKRRFCRTCNRERSRR